MYFGIVAHLRYHAKPVSSCGVQGSHPSRTGVTLSPLLPRVRGKCSDAKLANKTTLFTLSFLK